MIYMTMLYTIEIFLIDVITLIMAYFVFQVCVLGIYENADQN